MPVPELTTAVADLIPGHHESRRREHSNDAGRRPRLTLEQPDRHQPGPGGLGPPPDGPKRHHGRNRQQYHQDNRKMD